MEQSETVSAITPRTKVGELLKNYPELENVLIDMAPEFSKLRNPILRRTVVRVVTLSQVAEIGKISLGEMINKLRSAAGIQERFVGAESDSTKSTMKPEWFDASRIAQTLDARAMINAGEFPLNKVLNELKSLNPGDIYELMTPFVPVPLIENIKKQRYQTWSVEDGSDMVRTYIWKNNDK